MSSLQEIRKRMDTIKNTQKITKAIKMVSTIKLKKAQKNLTISRFLPNQLEECWDVLVQLINGEVRHPLITSKKEQNKIILVVVTSDHGLCGAFNTKVIQKVKEFIRQRNKKEIRIISLGEKGTETFRYHKIQVFSSQQNFFYAYSMDRVSAFTHQLTKMYIEESFDAVYCIYTKINPSFTTTIQNELLLPFSISISPHVSPKKTIWLIEPNLDEIITEWCELYLLSKLNSIFQESMAAEQLLRMQAMDNASRNAEEIVEMLKMEFNKKRQELITKEVLEIISGSEDF